jgi:hypothetical protein
MPALYSRLPLAETVYHYAAYGISIRSDAPLPFLQTAPSDVFELEVRNNHGPLDPSIRQEIRLEQNPSTAFDVGSLSDGSNYVGLRGIGDILVSPDGRTMACHCYPKTSSEPFNVYLLTLALSFALVKCGLEPLHGTAVAIDGKAAVFLGDCGLGKSTLAAAFLRAGYRLLTDDLLVLRKVSADLFAYPGSPRIKLFPEMASKFLGDSGRGVPMNPLTRKLIIPLTGSQVCTHVLPVGAIYALAPASEVCGTKIDIAAMNQRQAFLTLLASTFNRAILDSTRLRRQFEATQALANTLAVKVLSYPRSLDYLPAVLDAVASDLCAENYGLACGA